MPKPKHFDTIAEEAYYQAQLDSEAASREMRNAANAVHNAKHIEMKCLATVVRERVMRELTTSKPALIAVEVKSE